MTGRSSLIPVTVLTGFLGAGKTTLLNRLIDERGLADALVIINEFGAVGLDHDLVARSNEDDTIVEMASGCLCCTIRSNLKKTLEDAPERFAKGADPGFSRVIIETTGLADPAPIIHTVMADEQLTRTYYLAEVITLVDAVNGAETLDLQEEAVKQVAVADMLLISKTDIADTAVLSALEQRLRALNPAAPILHAADHSMKPEALLGQSSFNPEIKGEKIIEWLRQEAHDHHPHNHHPHDHHSHDHHEHGHDHDHAHDVNRHDERIRSVSLTLDQPLSAAVFDEWFGLLMTLGGANMLRVKGLIHLEDIDKPLVIHGVQHIWHPPVILPEWPSADRRSRIVFILRDMEKSGLMKALDFVQQRQQGAQLLGENGMAA